MVKKCKVEMGELYVITYRNFEFPYKMKNSICFYI